MAETKASKTKTKTKAKAKKAKPKKPASNGTKPSAKSANGKAAKGAGKAAKGSAKAAKDTANAAKGEASANGNGAGAVVEKAKLPLLATGAALVGTAAVIVSKNGHHKHRKVLGVPVPGGSKSHMPKVSMPKVSVPKIGLPKGKGLKGDVRRAAGAVTDAAKQADQIGKRISRVANSVQAVSETTDQAAKKS